MRAYWDKTTLTEYLSLRQIPRGLRIKKFPTFDLFNDDLKKRWTDALSFCSQTLMSLIIESKTKEIDRLQQEIHIIQQNLLPLKTLSQFADLDKKLDDKMTQLEKNIVSGKKEKMLRDKCDYDTDNVYTWKSNRSWRWNQRFGKKRVSFSDPETEYFDNTMAITESDNSMDHVERQEAGSATSTPAPSKNGKHKAKWGRKRGGKRPGEEAGKGGGAYSLRHGKIE